jgi:hypothetical protein
MLKGVNFDTDGPHVTHLLFADDIIVFLEATVESMHALREVLLAYESASGQKVNLQKSSIYFGDGCNLDRKNELKQELGVLGYRPWLGDLRRAVFSISLSGLGQR